jgi:hypothetical protein
MFIIMLVYILLLFFFFFGKGGVLCRAFIALGLRCYAHSLFSMGHIYLFFFENRGLGLGPALFRLGTRVSPAMQKNFNLSWKFFQIVGETWGLKLVKPPLSGRTWFGNLSKRSGKNWDLRPSQIAIGWSDPVWKFIQTIGDKLGFDTCQIAIG